MDLINEIFKITKDKISGSVSILKQVQKAIYIYCNIENTLKKDILIKSLTTLFNETGQFAAVYHFIDSILFWLEKKYPGSTYLESKEVLSFLDKYNHKWNNVNKEIADNLYEYLQKINYSKVLLHSYSSTICEVFETIKDKITDIEVYQTISNPNKEGKLQAKFLNNLGYKVKVVEDSLTGIISNKVDFAILGADVVFEDFFINKIGSSAITHLFNFHEKPVLVLTDSRKFISSHISIEIINKFKKEKLKPKDEIWKNAPNGIETINYYFEEIPNHLVSYFITEIETFNTKQVKKIIKS